MQEVTSEELRLKIISIFRLAARLVAAHLALCQIVGIAESSSTFHISEDHEGTLDQSFTLLLILPFLVLVSQVKDLVFDFGNLLFNLLLLVLISCITVLGAKRLALSHFLFDFEEDTVTTERSECKFNVDNLLRLDELRICIDLLFVLNHFHQVKSQGLLELVNFVQ